MIPITSFVNLINFAVPIVLSVRIYKIYKINKSDLLFYFATACFVFSFYWLIGGFSGILVHSLNTIGVLNVIKFVFLYLALFFIVKIPMNLLEQKLLGTLLSIALIACMILFVIVGFLKFSPSQIVVIRPFVYWVPIFPHWIDTMTGILSVLVISIFIISFAYLAWRDWSNPAIVRRSLYIIAGMGVMMIGGVFRFLTINFLAFYFFVFSSIFVSIGLLIIADGILHEHKQNSVKGISDINNGS